MKNGLCVGGWGVNYVVAAAKLLSLVDKIK